MQVTGARVICVQVCGNVQEVACANVQIACAERAGVVCRNVHIACVGRACGMCEVAYGVRVMCTLCGMHLSG